MWYTHVNLDALSIQDHITILGHTTDKVKLQAAKLHSEPSKCALSLMSCLFSDKELVNGNPSGKTNSKDEDRQKSIKKLDPGRIKYIRGMCIQYNYILRTCLSFITAWPAT